MGKKNTLKNFWVRLESASSTVTGSLIYLKPNFPNGKKEPELVFDCGTFLDSENKKYNKAFPCKPANIHAVFITHEHVDHMGRLAGFYNQGYKGKVFASEYTVQVIKSEAIKNYFFTMRNNEEPKHEEKDAISLINGCISINIGETINIDDNVEIVAYNNAHTKGAVMYKVVFKYEGHKIRILITGDYKKKGIYGKSYFPHAEKYKEKITIVTEATNGTKKKPVAHFKKDLEKSLYEGKSILCSSTGNERYEDILYAIKTMQEAGKISSDIPIYLEVKSAFDLSKLNLNVLPFNFNLVNNSNARKTALYDKRQKIIVVANYGAFTYYFPNVISKNNWGIFFVNHMYKGSLAERLMAPRGTIIKYCGKEYKKEATAYHTEEFSAHYYIDEFKELIEGFLDINAVFLGHGESESKKELQEEAQKRNGLNVQILKRGEAFKIFEDKIRHSS